MCVYLFSILYVTTQNTAWASRKRPQDKFDESKYAFFSFLFYFTLNQRHVVEIARLPN